MYRSKLIRITSSLKESQLDFIKNKLEGNKTNASLLFKQIIPYFPFKEETEQWLKKEVVYKKLFKNEMYSEGRIMKIMTELSKIIEHCIYQAHIEENFFYKKLTLLEYYLNNGLDTYFETDYKELVKHLSNEKESIDLYYKKYQLEELYIEFKLKETDRNANYNLLYQNLQLLSTIGELRIKNLSIVTIKESLEFNHLQSNLQSAHNYINLLFKDNDEIYFEKCMAIIKDETNGIEGNELRTIIVLLINYCIYKINKKITIYLKHILYLHKLLIQYNILLEKNNTLTPAVFKNIITVSLRLKEIDFTENFINQFSVYLPSIHKEEIYHFSLAQLYLYKRDYEKTLQILKSHNFKDIFYKTSIKRLQIMSLYCLSKKDDSYIDVLGNILNAFKKYIYINSELSESYIISNKNFYKVITKLNNIQDNKIKLKKMLLEVENFELLAEYNWLIDIIHEQISSKR